MRPPHGFEVPDLDVTFLSHRNAALKPRLDLHIGRGPQQPLKQRPDKPCPAPGNPRGVHPLSAKTAVILPKELKHVVQLLGREVEDAPPACIARLPVSLD